MLKEGLVALSVFIACFSEEKTCFNNIFAKK